MFDTVLVANRGEIAVRIIRTLRRMGVRSVAVYSDADAAAAHTRQADVAIRLGPAAASESYLSIPDVVGAALNSGAQAIHPGYGFLSENPEFARACVAAGLSFIGPTATAIEAMGDKIQAKATVSQAGVPVVPGVSDLDSAGTDIADTAEEVGYPLLLKPSAGGGGKGMRLVRSSAELADAVASARRESAGAFGDDRLLMERFVTTPRHIEIQVLADGHGHVIHLGERECSLQRRHQKIIEEAPSPLLDADTRDRMGDSAVEAARSVDYVGAGTVEFIVSGTDAGEFFFMEMNTRLQVEHPVTELVTGLDLVEWQLRVAAGERLTVSQQDVRLDGHAVEARVYAEDPANGFVPTGGTVLDVAEPEGAGLRVDSWLTAGTVIGSNYDPMLAKVIAWGADRGAALQRLDRALSETAVLGVGTNVSFLRNLIAHPDVRDGTLDTELVARVLPQLTGSEVSDELFAAAAMDLLLGMWPNGPVVDPWDVPNGWRLSDSDGVLLRLRAGDIEAVLRVRGTPCQATISVDEADAVPATARHSPDGRWLALHHAGVFRCYRRALTSEGTLWLAREGAAYAVGEQPTLLSTQGDAAGGGPVTSPMPGNVLAVKVSQGQQITAGAPLMIVEAMKMEHTITAEVDGVVSELYVDSGQQVGLDEPLAVVTPQQQEQE